MSRLLSFVALMLLLSPQASFAQENQLSENLLSGVLAQQVGDFSCNSVFPKIV